MFENDVVGLDADATLTALEGNEHAAVQVEVTRLLLAAHWADLHPGDAVDPGGIPGAEPPVQPGGDGTPEIADFAPAELGCSLKMSAGSAARLIADALDLRHRLPKRGPPPEPVRARSAAGRRRSRRRGNGSSGSAAAATTGWYRFGPR